MRPYSETKKRSVYKNNNKNQQQAIHLIRVYFNIRLIAENKKNLHNEERILVILLSNFRVFVRCLLTMSGRVAEETGYKTSHVPQRADKSKWRRVVVLENVNICLNLQNPQYRNERFVKLVEACQVKKSLIMKDSPEQHGNTSLWHRYNRNVTFPEVTKTKEKNVTKHSLRTLTW